jgi:hypothetical protein
VLFDVLHHGLNELGVLARFHIAQDAAVLADVQHVVVDVDDRRILALRQRLVLALDEEQLVRSGPSQRLQTTRTEDL